MRKLIPASVKAKIKKSLRASLGGIFPEVKTPPPNGYFKEADYVRREEDRSFPIDVAEIKKFKDIHRGQRCFIIGNGPSLNKLDLTKLKNEYTFAVNGFFYKTEEVGLVPSYYVVEDNHVIADNVAKINECRAGHKFFPSIYSSVIKKSPNTSFFLMNMAFYLKSNPNYAMPRFSMDCSQRIYCGQSVTIINLQLAHYMGFEKVYLIGMDFSYTIPNSAKVDGLSIESTTDDLNHFHPEYFGKGKKWHDPQLDKVLLSYKHCKFVYEATNRQILNATAGGQLESFERADFNSLFV